MSTVITTVTLNDLSSVLHLLIPVCQTFAPLLLLPEGFLGLSTEVFIFNDFADLFASFGRPFTVADILIRILLTTLLKYNKKYGNIIPLYLECSN